jgi:hypothetical protein
VVARARTGSGKTLAYLLPALHRVIASGGEQQQQQQQGGWQVLVLVPTRELCEQVRAEALAVTQHCGMDIGVGEPCWRALLAGLAGGAGRAAWPPGRLAAADDPGDTQVVITHITPHDKARAAAPSCTAVQQPRPAASLRTPLGHTCPHAPSAGGSADVR